MTIKGDPANYEIGEFTPILPPLVVSLNDVTEGTPSSDPDQPGTPGDSTPVAIKSVSAADSGIHVTSSGNTFTVTGQFNDTFVRKLDYRDVDNIIKTVPTFTDITPNYNTLFTYVAPAEATKSAYITVVLEGDSTYQYQIIVRNNWQAANNMLKQYVVGGKF